jgi:3-methyl-2-oxobutanoate hydroxymethyltransferase
MSRSGVRSGWSRRRAAALRYVFEAVPAAVTELIVGQLEVPTIGIGAGPATAGHGEMVEGVGRFAAEVRSGSYPALEHGYEIDASELAAFRAAVGSANSWLSRCRRRLGRGGRIRR